MRKILSAVCAASVIAIMSAAGVNAEDTTINVSFGEAVRYDTAIRVPVIVENNIGVQAVSLGISCDSDNVVLKAVESNGLFADAEFNYNISDNNVVISYTDDTYLYNNEGTLCTLLFTASDINNVTEIPLTFEGSDTYVVDKCQDRQGCTVISADVKIPQFYTVKYETNGGAEITDKSYTYGSQLLERAERDDYIFEGWYTDSDLTDRFDGTVRTDLTLYAAWTPEDKLIEDLTANIYNESLFVDFTVYGQTSSDNNKIIVQVNDKDGRVLAIKTQDLPLLDQNTQNVSLKFDTAVLGTTEVDVSVMIWNPFSTASPATNMKSVVSKNTALITLKNDNNSLIGYEYAEIGKAYMPIAPDVEGNTFNGWTNAKGIEWNDSSIVNGDMTLFANYKTNECTVTLYSETLETLTIGYGEKLTQPNNIQGYTIEGWYTEDGSRWDFNTDTVTKDLKLYPKWKANYYTVTFRIEGNEAAYDTQYIKYGGLVTKPDDPSLQYNQFGGWITQGDAYWDFSTNRVTSDMTLNATWNLDKYTVFFETNGGTTINPITVDANTTIEKPQSTKEGYYVSAWLTDDGTEWDFDYSTVKDNTTLTAVWTIIDWVKASDVPENGEIIDEKWSYTLREYTTNSASSLSGWTKYDTKRTSWGGTQGPVYSDPSNGVRNVWSEGYVSSYNYKHIYRFYKWGYSSTDYSYSYNSGGGRSYLVVDVEYYPSTTGQRPVDKNGSTFRWWTGNAWSAVWYESERDEIASENWSTRWYYQEPVYTYYYYRDLSKEAITDPSGQSNVSNVVKWVKYIIK